MDELSQVAFPILSSEHMALARNVGEVRTYSDGEAIWHTGDAQVSCFVIVSGGIDIWVTLAASVGTLPRASRRSV